MKEAAGIVLVLGMIIGGALFANYITKIAKTECANQCPSAETALKTHFAVGPVELTTCNCPQPD